MADKTEIQLFNLLKGTISEEVRKSYPANDEKLDNWKGVAIKNFQDELERKVNGRISEKWFYTHFKGDNGKLPRIDILDMLSQYCDYESWEKFVEKHQTKVRSRKPLMWILKATATLATIITLLSFLKFDYELQILDFYSKDPLPNGVPVVYQIIEGESPLRIDANEDGKYLLKSKASKITLAIKAPYYYTDTIRRNLKLFNHTEKIYLRPDDYTLMIHHFATANISDWEAKRDQLRHMISHNAVMVMLDMNGRSMDMLDREEFIDWLSIPAGHYNGIEMMDTRYHNEKICFMRFKVLTNE